MIIHPLLTPLMSAIKNSPFLEEKEAASKFTPLIKAIAASADSLEQHFFQVVDRESGYQDHIIYEGDQHSPIYIKLKTWLPGRGYPPHNHGTWSISASIVGSEEHTLWQTDDSVTVRQIKKIICNPGEVIALSQDAIHSVANCTNAIALSLHIYGQNPNRTQGQDFKIN